MIQRCRCTGLDIRERSVTPCRLRKHHPVLKHVRASLRVERVDLCGGDAMVRPIDERLVPHNWFVCQFQGDANVEEDMLPAN